MNRYNIMKQLGDGTYGSVLLATSHESGDKVAIKRMKKKYYSWDECLNLREVKSLRKLSHPNIVKLKEVIRENDQLFFVFEFMKENLYQLMKDRDKLFPDSVVRNMIYQVLQGLSFMHKHGFFHRDLKPENLLCQGPELVKIADFGLAREIRSRPPYTDYVSTRWYRAPEVLLRATNYSSPIDIWAVGAIMAELYTLRPLFPGSSEIDMMFKICSVLGTPKQQEWEEGYKLASAMNFRWPQCVPTNLKSLVPNASNDGIQIMKDMLLWNPQKRPTAGQCLKYSIFQVGKNLGAPISSAKMRSSAVESASMTPTHHTSPAKLAPTKPPASDNWPWNEPEAKLPSIPPVKKQDDDFAVMQKGKKSARKRWGGGPDSTWDDWDDLDFSLPKANKKAPLPPAPRKEANKENDDDFYESLFGKKKNMQTPKTKDRNASRGREGSAKQVYMNKSRYLPGINPLNSGRGLREDPMWSPNLTKPVGGGAAMRTGRGPNFDSPAAGYVPSFIPNKNTSYQGWKRAQPSFQPNPTPGVKIDSGSKPHRTDWAARYLKS